MSADNELAILSYQSAQGTRYRAAVASSSGLSSVPPDITVPWSDEMLLAIFATWHKSRVFQIEEEAQIFLKEKEAVILDDGGYIEYGNTEYLIDRDFPTPEEAWEAVKRLGLDRTLRWDKMPRSWLVST